MQSTVAERTEAAGRGELPYAALFLLLAALYYHPLLTQGALPLASDSYLQNYPLRAFYAQALKSGTFPLWNPYEFAGLPYAGATQTGAFYPPNIILYRLFSVWAAFGLSLVLHAAAAGFFTFIYLRELGLGRAAAMAGGVAFAFLGFITDHKEHTAIVNAAVWLPLVLFFLERMANAPATRWALALSLSLAAQAMAGNFQICLYTYMVVAPYGIVRAVGLGREGGRRFISLASIGAALGAVMALPQLMATLELGSRGMRPVIAQTLGYVFSREFHVYLKTLPSLLLPGAYLYPPGRAALGVPQDAILAFVGSLPLVIALVVVFRDFTRDWRVRFFAVVACMGLLLAVADDTPLGRLLFHVPLYGSFRAHGRNLFEFSFAASVLAALGLHAIMASGRLQREATLALAATVAAAAFGAAMTRGAIPLSDPRAYASVVFPLLYSAWGAWLLFHARARLARAAASLLIVLIFAEGYVVYAPYMAGWTARENAEAVCGRMGYDRLPAEGGGAPPRVLRLDAATSDLINVRCGAGVLNAYDQMAPHETASLFDLDPLGYSRYADHLLMNNRLLSMMNVRYVMVPAGRAAAVESIGAGTAAFAFPISGEGRRMLDPTVRVLSPPEAPERNIAKLSAGLPAGSYLVSFKARSLGPAPASLRMEAFSEATRVMRFDYNPLYVYPGMVGPEEAEYYRVFHAAMAGGVEMAFIAPRMQAVEVRDLTIEELPGYGPQAPPGGGPVYVRMAESANSEEYSIYENRNALPRAYAVERVVLAEDWSHMKRMFDLGLADPRTEAVLFEGDAPEGRAFSRGRVEVRDYGLHRVSLETDFEGEGFVVLADWYYPGWQAEADGTPVRLYRANGVLRGVAVPAGRHELVFEYRPAFLYAALSASALAALGAAAGIVLFRKEGRSA